MHIPDGFLGAGVAAATWGVAGVGVAAALRAERRDPNPMPAGMLGAVAGFVFAAQMVNVPVAPGTSGHLVGATLAACILGPSRALMVMAVVLTIQAVLFQDGGLTALGANLLDMGVAGAFVGYAVATLVGRRTRSPRGYAIGAMLGAFAATLAAAALTALWLGLSGLYPLAGILPLLMMTHVAIGVLEAALTGAILVTLLRWRPDLIRGFDANLGAGRAGALVIGVLGVGLAVAAFLAPLASSLPDGLERSAEVLGFAERARVLWRAPFPDYNLPFRASAGLAAAVTGILGTLAVALAAWLISRGLAGRHDAIHR